MAIVFAVRGTSKDAYYSNGGKTGVDAAAEWTVTADGTAISGSALVPGANNNRKAILWQARKNWPNGREMSILVRVKPAYTGAPAATRALMVQPYACNGRLGRIEITHAITSGNVNILATNQAGSTVVNSNFGAWSPTSGTWYDLVFTWDGTTAANAMQFYVDGTLLGQLTASAAYSASWTNEWFTELALGDTIAGNVWNGSSVEEIVIWDEVIDPLNVTLVSGSGGDLNGASRTSLVDVANFDGTLITTAKTFVG